MINTIIYSIPGLISLVMAITLLFKKGRNHAQAILAIVFILYAIGQVAYAQYCNPVFQDNVVFDPLFTLTFALLPSFCCLFIANLTYPQLKIKSGLLFFVVSVPYLILYFILLSLTTPESYAAYSGFLFRRGEFVTALSSDARMMCIVGEIVFFIMMVTMLILTMYAGAVRIRKYHIILSDFEANAEDKITMPKALVFHFTYGFIPILIIESTLPADMVDNYFLSITISVMSSVFIVFMTIYGHKITFTAEDIKKIMDETEDEELKYSVESTDSSILSIDLDRYPEVSVLRQNVSRLVHFIDIKEGYLDPELSIVSLSKIINVDRVYANRLIDILYNKSFYDYIADKRIDRAKKLIAESGRDLNIEVLPKLCGYYFYAVFEKEFKEKTGKTPSEYSASL